jgi:outer membrane protein
MRLVLTLAFLVSASLLGAEPGALASTSAPASPLTLDKAIDQALLHNLGLAVTRLSAANAVEGVEIAQAPFDPAFSWTNTLSGSRTATQLAAGDPADRSHYSAVGLSQRFTWGGTLSVGANMTRAWTESGDVGTASDYNLGTTVSYSQPLLAGGWRVANLTTLIAARQGAYRGRLALRSATLDLIRDTEIAYWSLAGARTLVAARETSLRSSESLLAQIKARRALGDATLLEELQAEADVSAQRVALLSARQSVDGAEMSLRRVLGRGDVADVEKGIDVQPLPADPVPPPADFRAWVRVAAGFDFATAIQLSSLAQADALVEQATQNDKPSLNLTVASSTAGSPALGFSAGYDRLRQQAGWGNSASLVLSFPIGFRESAATLRSAARTRRQAELQLVNVRQDLVFNARSAWRDLEAANARVTASAAGLELQRKSYEGERARYAAGQSDILRVLQAQAGFDAAQVAWLQASLDARVAFARVGRLDGTILSRHGLRMDAVERQVGLGLEPNDPLPPFAEPQ